MNEIEKYLEEYWVGYNGEPELIGLTPFGFKGDKPLNIESFEREQLDWALSFAHACGEPINTINKRHTSYGLKQLAEKRARKLSAHDEKRVDYISNGALILAMVDAGFRILREGDSPNVFFNVSERALKKLYKQYSGF